MPLVMLQLLLIKQESSTQQWNLVYAGVLVSCCLHRNCINLLDVDLNFGSIDCSEFCRTVSHWVRFNTFSESNHALHCSDVSELLVAMRYKSDSSILNML